MIRVANAPCSWGVIENIAGERITYETVLNEIHSTGYSGTELGDWGFMPTDPAQLTAELAQRQLTLLGSWVSVQLHDAAQHAQSVADAVQTARLLAAVGGSASVIVLGNDPYGDPFRSGLSGRVRPEHSLSEARWRVFVAGATQVARAVQQETGLRTVFHHHIGTWVETPAETQMLLERTDPDLLGLCFDTGHWTFAGGDAVAGLRQHAGRIWHVHFKDCHPAVARQAREQAWDGPTAVGHGVFCELGRGQVDFPAVLATLTDIGYTGWIVVEQDVLPGMGTPLESARRNRAYLHSIGL
ncbi:MAG: TIM barrel protein [Anaerolineae bacterium]|jgi:inosose dehydratase|nr:TIM barrel protein [Anaerolineae bacterium]